MYKINGNFTNCQRCRYLLNGALNDILLSQNARLILESAYLPSISGNYVNVRIVTSTQDIVVNTSKYISDNPILFTSESNLTITNSSELFYSIDIP